MPEPNYDSEVLSVIHSATAEHLLAYAISNDFIVILDVTIW